MLLEAFTVMVHSQDGFFSLANYGIGMKMRRDIHQRRAYAAQRAVMAVDKASQMASAGSCVEREQAFRWMRLWMAFAASRPVSTPVNVSVQAA